MKKILIISVFYCIGLHHAYGMEEEISEQYKQVSALASLAVYGDEHEGSKAARLALEGRGYVAEIYEELSVDLRMQYWVHATKPCIIATRGTVVDSIKNFFSDGAIFSYGLPDQDPLQFGTQLAKVWQTNGYITDPTDDLVNNLPSPSTVYKTLCDIKEYVAESRVGYLGAMVGGVFVGLAAYYGGSKIVGYFDPTTRAINTLVSACQFALKKTNEWLMSDLNKKHIITAHSLGGLIANVTAELSWVLPHKVITFNAPAVAASFIQAQKAVIMGAYQDPIVNKCHDIRSQGLVTTIQKSYEPPEFRCITYNIGRENEIVSCFGGDRTARKSILISDYVPSEPLNFGSYAMENHSMFNIAKYYKVFGEEEGK